ncbi:Aspartate aminotransferase [Lactiplantibacillus plantarum]|nr:Aspartate aminotransferase [Lactiplantibacillus plantarum]
MVNTILKEADLFCPNSVRINFTIYHKFKRVLIIESNLPQQKKSGRIPDFVLIVLD